MERQISTFYRTKLSRMLFEKLTVALLLMTFRAIYLPEMDNRIFTQMCEA